MLWRAGSGYRPFPRPIVAKSILSDLPSRWVSLPVHTNEALPSHKPPGEPPIENVHFRFTGKVSRALLSKFPPETAAFVSVIEELSVRNLPRGRILATLQTLSSEFDILSSPKRTCALVQQMVQAGFPDRAMHILNIAHSVGLVLPHNQYEQIAYQLALRNYWRYLRIVATMARRMTGSWTVRLLNWAMRSYIETQEYGLLSAALGEFERCQLKPTRRSYHLLVEGHLRNSDLSRARDCLVGMQGAGIDMNESTYIVVINAYRALGPNDTVEAQAFQALQGTGGTSDTMILNGIMKLRIDAGDVPGALRVLTLFTLSPDSDNGAGRPPCLPDKATFNILLMLLARRKGQLNNIFRIYHQMTSAGHQADTDTVTALVVAYSTASMTGSALSLVYDMCKHHHLSVDRNEFNLLGRLTEVTEPNLDQVCSVSPNSDVFNALLRAVLPQKGLIGMRRVLRIMRQASVLPDATTIQIILSYLHDAHHISPRSLIKVLAVLINFPAYEASLTVQHLNTILRSLVRGELDIIRTSSWNASAQRVRFGHVPRFSSQRLSKVAPNFDPTAGISLDSFQRRIGKISKPIVENLLERQVMSDRMTFALRIRRDAVIKLDIRSAERAFDIMVARGIRANGYHYSALMEGYVLLGRMEDARNVIERAFLAGVKPSVIMYTILINGFGRLGQPDLAKQTFTEMVARGVKPDFAAVDAVVSAYWFVRAYKTSRNLLLDLWPLVAQFPPALQGAPLRELLAYLRTHRGSSPTKTARAPESRRERLRRIAVRRTMRRTLSELEQWQQVEEALSWAKADIGLGHMLQADISNTRREYDSF
ncbi:hypothetical protein JB92DRAFT_2975118 [Gautieria morchelliformis]|nr:hypothetical protein JB92DRAFT_2975118 [Gautieria morchelliformis]